MRKMTKRLCTAAGVLFLAAALVLAFTGSLARFRSMEQKVVRFSIRPSDQMVLLTPDDTAAAQGKSPAWNRENGTMTLGFRVAGVIDPAKESQPYCVRLYVDDGIPSSQLTVTLTANSQTYTGRAARIREGSQLYRELGPGYLYSFYLGSAAQEVQWDLQSAQDQESAAENQTSILYSRSFEVKVSGVGDAPVMTELCVESVTPAQAEKAAQTASSSQSSESEAASSEAQSTETTEEQQGG